MQEISNQLSTYGFSISSLSKILERNNYSNKFSTSEFFCIFLTAQDLYIKVEDESLHISGGNAIFIGPQKVVELMENIVGKEFFTIAFSSKFYETNFHDSYFINSEIFFSEKSPVFVAPYFGNSEFNKVVLIERLAKFSLKGVNMYRAAAHNTIEALLLDAYIHIKDIQQINQHSIDSISYANRFKVFLHRDFRSSKNVSYYADLLRISPRKLTQSTEQVWNKNAKQIIIDKVKFEAEKAIKFTSKSLSEITYELGFKDESNFTNFVKKHIGEKPSEIRLREYNLVL